MRHYTQLALQKPQIVGKLHPKMNMAIQEFETLQGSRILILDRNPAIVNLNSIKELRITAKAANVALYILTLDLKGVRKLY